jgi:hypothetical protein
MNELEQLLNRLIEFGLLTDTEEQMVHKALLNIEIHITPKTGFIEFIDQFNQITGKKFTPNLESRELYYENDSLYSNSDRIAALKNALNDPWVKENSTVLTPKWSLRPETIGKYINYEPPKSTLKSNKGSSQISGTNYSDITV